MKFGLDYAWHTLSPVSHKSVGSSFAIRYLSDDPTKNLTRAEADELRAGGVDVVVVWETAAQRALAGFTAGADDARAALSQASACGIPVGRPIYFAVDFDETTGEAGAVDQYFRGVASILGVAHTGCYGGYWAVKRLFDAKLISYGWQTYAWSGGNLDKRAQLYQFSNNHSVAGVSVDFNHALATDFGQWSYEPPKPAPKRASGIFNATVSYDHDAQTVKVVGAPGHVLQWGDVNERIRLELDLEVGGGNPKVGQWAGRVIGTEGP